MFNSGALKVTNILDFNSPCTCIYIYVVHGTSNRSLNNVANYSALCYVSDAGGGGGGTKACARMPLFGGFTTNT